MALTAIFFAALVGFIARAGKKRGLAAWAIGCLVVPSFILFTEFVLPYQGGGASMWPIAMVFGGIYGAIASAVGVFLASMLLRGASRNA